MIKPPVIYLFDTDIRMIGQIRKYTSLKYQRAWKSVGEKFEITLADYEEVLPLLHQGYYISLDGDPWRCGCIRGIRLSESDTRTVVVTGYPCKWLARTRINKQHDNAEVAKLNFGYDSVPLARYEGDPQEALPAESVLKEYAYRHMVQPDDEKRRIPRMVVADDKKRGKAMRWLAENGTQLDVTLENVCDYAEIGYDIRLNIPDHQLVFDVSVGVDRSCEQSDRQAVVFSAYNRNVSSMEYNVDDEPLRNVVYAKSEETTDGIHAQPAYSSETTTPSGLERREMYSDCTDLSLAETSTSVPAKTKALQEMATCKTTYDMTCSAIDTGEYEYRKDWDVGDLISLEMVSFGKMVTKRIVTVTEEYASGAYRVTPGFKAEETARVKLIRRLKKIVVGGK